MALTRSEILDKMVKYCDNNNVYSLRRLIDDYNITKSEINSEKIQGSFKWANIEDNVRIIKLLIGAGFDTISVEY